MPCGIYKITGTLNLITRLNVSVIGEDNSTDSGRCTTTIVWSGSSAGTMLFVKGVAYGSFNRLTFDLNSLAKVGVDQSEPNGFTYFDTSSQYADDVFKNGLGGAAGSSFGIRCGGNFGDANGCSETEVLRSTFTGLGAGFGACNANAVDEWVWYSTFSGNGQGITSDYTPGSCFSGSIHAVGNVFLNQTVVDVASRQGATNVIRNYSSGSKKFYNGLSTFGVLQGNTIVNTTDGVSVFQATHMTDNDIVTLNTNTAPVVDASNGSDIFSMNNRFTVASAIHSGNCQQAPVYCQVYAFDDTVVSSTVINQTAPALPPMPIKRARTVYEASPSGSGTTCSYASPCSVQTAVCRAATATNDCSGSVSYTKNIVHLRPGTYTISSTITVPASDIQIVGDGWYTELSGNAGVNPLLLLSGPSQVTLRHLSIAGNANTDDMVKIANADQVGAVVFAQGLSSSSMAQAISVAVNNATVELHDFQFAQPSGVAITGSGTGSLRVFFGATFAGASSLALSNGIKFMAVGTWQDGATGGTFGSVSGAGSVTYVGSQVVLNYGSGTYRDFLDFSGFTGNAAALGIVPLCVNPFVSGYRFTGTLGTGGRVLGAGNFLVGSSPFSLTGGTTEFFTNRYWNSTCDNLTKITDNSQDVNFLRAVLAPYHTTLPFVPVDQPISVTNAKFYRVNIRQGGIGLHVIQ